jgi:hypothetical protein
MGSSGGGGGGSPPRQPTPTGQITGFGAATPFNPNYHSVLADNMGWADVDEIDAASARAAQQRAAMPPPPQAPQFDENALRQMLAQMMQQQRNPPNTPQQQAAMRIAARPGGQGTYAGMGGGASYTGSSPMRR